MKPNDNEFEEQLRQLRPTTLETNVESLFYRAGWDAATIKLRLGEVTLTGSSVKSVRDRQLSFGTFFSGLLCGVAVMICMVILTSPQPNKINLASSGPVKSVPLVDQSAVNTPTLSAENVVNNSSTALHQRNPSRSYGGKMEADLLAMELAYTNRGKTRSADSISANVNRDPVQVDPVDTAQAQQLLESQSWKFRIDLLRELQM